MNRFARVGRALVLVLAGAFAVVVVVSYHKPGARTEGARDPVAETLVAEAHGARDRMRFRDFQYDETREAEGRYRVTATEAVRFDEKGERVFRLKDVVFESRESKDGADGLHSRTARRAHRGIARVPRLRGRRGRRGGHARHRALPSATTRRAASSPPTGRSTRRAAASSRTRTPAPSTRATGFSSLEGDARLRGRGDEGRPVELRAPRVVVGRNGRLEASGGAVLKTERFVLRAATFVREAQPEGSHVKATTDARLLVPPERGQPPAAAHGRSATCSTSRSTRTGQPAVFEASAARRSPARSRADRDGGREAGPGAALLGPIPGRPSLRAERAGRPARGRGLARRRPAGLRPPDARGRLRATHVRRRSRTRHRDVRQGGRRRGRNARRGQGPARDGARTRRDGRLLGRARPAGGLSGRARDDPCADARRGTAAKSAWTRPAT